MSKAALAVGIACAVVLLGGCQVQQTLLPSDYAGPKAVLVETFKKHSGVEADFFGVERINGTTLENSAVATRRQNAGRGIRMTPTAVRHDIPATLVEVALIGQSQYGAPILALMNRTYLIKGMTKFVAKPGATYTIKGELGPKYSAIWIVDDGDEIVGEKIEKRAD